MLGTRRGVFMGAALEKRAERRDLSSAFSRSLVGILLVASLAVLALAGAFLVRSRAQYLARSEANARNLSLMLGENLADSYEKIDLQVCAIKAEIERQLEVGGLDVKRLEEGIRRSRVGVPALEGLRVMDSSGEFVYGTDFDPRAHVSIADRDYFIRLRSDAKAGMVIARPLFGRITKTWLIVISRRIDQPDGSFGGIVSGTLPVDHLARLFSVLDLGRDGAISLRGLDQRVWVRQSRENGWEIPDGLSVVFPELTEGLLAGRDRGLFVAASPMDHLTRTYAFSRLRGADQLILVGLGRGEALSNWYWELLLTGVAAVICLALILAYGRLARGAWFRQAATTQALAEEKTRYQSIFESAFEGIFQINLDHSIRSINPAFARIVGYDSPGDMMAEVPSVDALFRGEEEKLRAVRALLVGMGRIDNLEAQVLRKDGSAVWVLMHAHLVRGLQGEPLHWEGMIIDIGERKEAEIQQERLILELQKALGEVKLLSGMLPICSHCKKIRDDHGYWEQIETYIASRSEANFTHGICPDCAKLLYAEFFEKHGRHP